MCMQPLWDCKNRKFDNWIDDCKFRIPLQKHKIRFSNFLRIEPEAMTRSCRNEEKRYLESCIIILGIPVMAW